MPRSRSPWPYWRTPGFNPAAGSEDDNHLPDDVVAMFRDSFDEDGLDFVKRGPRTAEERLAYAQRVRADAHLAAQPAPVDVQRRFAHYGVIDRNRYFVGSDGNVYARDESSAELGPAAARRSFESAVGGFAPVSFEQALGDVSPQLLSQLGTASGSEAGLWHRAAGVPRLPEAVPETQEEEIDRIEERYRDYAEYGRRHGHDEAAAAMERFLSGSGESMRLDPGWLRSVPSVRAAETQVPVLPGMDDGRAALRYAE